MKSESGIGVQRRGEGLAWARASGAGAEGPDAAGEGAPAWRGAESATLALPTADLLFRAERIPSSDSGEVAQAARLLLEAESPLDPSEMVFAHEVLSSDAEGTLVLAAAAPVAAVERLREAAGADPSAVARVDAAALGLARNLAGRPEFAASGRQPVFAEEDGRLVLMLFEDGRPALVRPAGSARAASGPALASALRLALLEAEMARGPMDAAPALLVSPSGSALLPAATAAATAAGRELRVLDAAALPPAAFGCARRTLEGASFDLFPDAWRAALAERRSRRRAALALGGAAALWVVLALVLFGWPSLLGSRIQARQARVDAAAPAEAAVQEVRDRIRIIDRYSDRTYSPLEVLREVSLAMPEGVTLARLSYDAARREASVECSALSSQPAYEMSNRLKVSPLFARNDIVAGPTENKGTGRTTFTIRLLFAGGGEEGGAP